MPDVRNLLTRCRRGSAIFMLLTIVGVLYIFGTMLINYMTQERAQTATRRNTRPSPQICG